MNWSISNNILLRMLICWWGCSLWWRNLFHWWQRTICTGISIPFFGGGGGTTPRRHKLWTHDARRQKKHVRNKTPWKIDIRRPTQKSVVIQAKGTSTHNSDPPLMRWILFVFEKNKKQAKIENHDFFKHPPEIIIIIFVTRRPFRKLRQMQHYTV